jgi:RNase H-like domain found in reverse transcriptase/Reverse transcriptase (RNA-dependent DNA polymerase)/Integrase zinc binding domain/Chromo (CHRromatin Organisation MOdifier) domain/Aspartyl protease
LTFDVTYIGRKLRVMIDSGATGNFISQSVIKESKLPTRTKAGPYRLTVVDGTEAGDNHGWIDVETPRGTLTFPGHEEWISLDVAPIGRHEIILGMPWIRKHNPDIDWVKGTIAFNRCRDYHDLIEWTDGEACAASRQEDHQAQGSPLDKIPTEYSEFLELFKEVPRDQALPKHQLWDHEIKMIGGAEPPYGPIYSLSANELSVLKEYIEENLEKGFIRESQSPAGAPILFAPKKDGKLRLCVDFRKLNDMTIKDRYALPRADELRDRIGGAVIFTKLDLRVGYNLIRMKEGEEWKTAFRTRYGHFEYLVMPMGLTNAPATFMRLMNNVLAECLDIFAVVYLDDILIYSKNYKEHVKHVHRVLTMLREANLLLKPEKCEFHVKETEFLGHIVSVDGIKMSQEKVRAVLDWPPPKTVTEVQSFLGFANYYRRFIRNYAAKTSTLSELTKKEIPFEWTKERQDTFEGLKAAFVSAPILIVHDPEKESTVETDASDKAIGAQLTQPGPEGRKQPIAYYSRKMTPAELNYDVHDKELLAVVEALREWRVYLEGAKYQVLVITDHKNLIYFTTTKQLNRRQVRWAETLASYNFRIVYRKGSENAQADALSRRADYMTAEGRDAPAIFRIQEDGLVYNKPEIAATWKVVPDQEIGNDRDTKWWDEVVSTAVEAHYSGVKLEGFTLQNGKVRYQGRIYLPKPVREEFIKEQHELPTHGHQGFAKTYARIARDYWCPGLKKAVEKVIRKCDVCIRSKAARHAPYGMLQPLGPPRMAWSSMAWDFIVKLPKSKEPLTGTEYDSILVGTERLTKYGYFIPWKEEATAEDLAYVFTRNIVANHGLPDEAISDRDKLFTSHFWTTLTALLGMRRKLSTAFHPQTDGQTERLNQTLEQYLRAYVDYQQDNWVQLLPLAQFAYNSAENETTGVSPFYANYGYEPTVFKEPYKTDSESQTAILQVQQLKHLHEQLKLSIQFIATKKAKYYNQKHCVGPTLKEGDKVYLLRKNLKTKRPSEKLDYKKLGPFAISKVIGPVNYELLLPTSMRIHPVFHISLLEPAPEGTPDTPVTTTEINSPNEEYDVEEILDSKYVRQKLHYLVRWSGYPDSENSWEPVTNLSCPEKLENFHRRNPVLPRMPGPGPVHRSHRGQGRAGRGQ